MLADQLPSAGSHPEAESTRSYCLATLVLTVGLCVLGVVLYLQYFSGGGVPDSKDDPSEVPQPAGPPTQLPPTDAGNVPVIPQEVPTMVDDEWYVQSQQTTQTLQKELDGAERRLTALEHEVKESKQAQRLAIQWREKFLALESEVLKLRHLDAELSTLKHKVQNTGNSNPGLDAKLQDLELRTFERFKRNEQRTFKQRNTFENDLKKCQESIMIETKTIGALKKEVDGLKSSDAATDFGPRKDVTHIAADRSGSMSSTRPNKSADVYVITAGHDPRANNLPMSGKYVRQNSWKDYNGRDVYSSGHLLSRGIVKQLFTTMYENGYTKRLIQYPTGWIIDTHSRDLAESWGVWKHKASGPTPPADGWEAIIGLGDLPRVVAEGEETDAPARLSVDST